MADTIRRNRSRSPLRALGSLMPLARNGQRAGACHGSPVDAPTGLPSVIIVGTPNVGKSLTFNRLTGAYVTVSNYPGTTVEVARGKCTIEGSDYEVIDTPGMYSLLPISEEERVARSILLSGQATAVVHVVDAKNLDRLLPMTVQLIETGLPVILDLNMMDEAERLGIAIDAAKLALELGIPVVATVATTGRGFAALRKAIHAARAAATARFHYGDRLEQAITAVESLLSDRYLVSRRAVALLLLQRDSETMDLVRRYDGERLPAITALADAAAESAGRPLPYLVALARQSLAERILSRCFGAATSGGPRFAQLLSRLAMHPVTGTLILLVVLYFGLYQFVGQFGAGTLVDFLEEVVFGQYVNPLATRLVVTLIPWPVLQSLFVGDYGLITLGFRYAVAIILPIVGTFFLVFSILEDSGYFPRLAMLIDRVFKVIGLNGRAVIPLVLGLGCDTMATVVTRVLETRRERTLATLLLALAVPCSAQLGVILGILSVSATALWLWLTVVGGVFLLVGFLAARLMPGERPSFYMEVPPLRMPHPTNVLTKTYARMEWYFLEVLPVFLLASVLIWLGQLTGVFQLLISALRPVMVGLGLPEQAAAAFLFGFFRRDYGAAGLYDLARDGVLSPVQMLVAAVTLTLFVPCIAQFSVMLKERGARATLSIVAFVFPFAFLVGWAVKEVLAALRVVL